MKHKAISHLAIATLCPMILAASSIAAAPLTSNNPMANQPIDQSALQPQMNGYPSGPQYIRNKSLYRNQDLSEQQDDLNLDSSEFGFNGPLSFSTTYSQNYGFILTGKYAQALGHSNAIGLEADAGSKQNRLNGTWGMALSNRQRLKLSAEYLWQDIDFNFDSGDVTQWVGQQAYGATYEYLVSNGFLQDINFNTTYSRAQTKNLAEKDFDNGTMENFRRIAGGTDKSGSAGVDLSPFSSTLVGLQLNYDDLTYNTKYQNNQNLSGLGGTVSLQQLLTKRTKLQLTGSDRKPSQNYTAEIDYLVHTRPGTQLQLGLTGSRNLGADQLASDTQVGINVAYSWGGDSKDTDNTYQAFSGNNTDGVDSHQGLSDWAADPAVHMDQVYAVADQESINKSTGQALNANAANPITPAITKALDEKTLTQGQALAAMNVTQGNAAQTIDDLFNNPDAGLPGYDMSIDTAHSGIYKGTTMVANTNIGFSTDSKTGDVQINSANNPIANLTPDTTYYAVMYVKTTAAGSTYQAPTAAGQYPGAIFFPVTVVSGAPKFNSPSITAPAITQGATWDGLQLTGNDPATQKPYVSSNGAFTISIIQNNADDDFQVSDDTEITLAAGKTPPVGTAVIQLKACSVVNPAACTTTPETVNIPVNPAPVENPSFSTTDIKANATAGTPFTIDLSSDITDPVSGDTSLTLVPTDNTGKTLTAWTIDGASVSPVAGKTGKTAITFTPQKQETITLYARAQNAKGISAKTATITITVAPKPAVPVPTFKNSSITAPVVSIADAAHLPGPAEWTLDLSSDITAAGGQSPSLLVTKNDSFTVSTNKPEVLTNKTALPEGLNTVQVEACNIITPTPEQCSTPATVTVDVGYIDNFSTTSLTAATAILNAPYTQNIAFTDNNKTTADTVTVSSDVALSQYGLAATVKGNNVVVSGTPSQAALNKGTLKFNLTLKNQFGASKALAVSLLVVQPPTAKGLADTETNVATPLTINTAQGFNQGQYSSTQTPVYTITKATVTNGDFKQTTDVTQKVQAYLQNNGNLEIPASAFPQGQAGEYVFTIQAGLKDSTTGKTYYSSNDTVAQTVYVDEAPVATAPLGPYKVIKDAWNIYPAAFKQSYSKSEPTTYTMDTSGLKCISGRIWVKPQAGIAPVIAFSADAACSGVVKLTAKNSVGEANNTLTITDPADVPHTSNQIQNIDNEDIPRTQTDKYPLTSIVSSLPDTKYTADTSGLGCSTLFSQQPTVTIDQTTGAITLTVIGKQDCTGTIKETATNPAGSATGTLNLTLKHALPPTATTFTTGAESGHDTPLAPFFTGKVDSYQLEGCQENVKSPSVNSTTGVFHATASSFPGGGIPAGIGCTVAAVNKAGTANIFVQMVD